MGPEKKGMAGYMNFKNLLKVKLADNRILLAYGKNNASLFVYDGARKVNVTSNDALYVSRNRNKLLSLSAVTERGAEVQFKRNSGKITIDGK